MDMRSNIEVAAPAAEVWHWVGERFGDLADWAPGLLSSHLEGELGVGAERVCLSEGFGPFAAGTVRERLIAFDRATMRLTYEATEGLPSWMPTAMNRWAVVPIDASRSRIEMHATVHLRGILRLLSPLMWLWGRQMSRKVVSDLTHAIERSERRLTSAGATPGT